MRTVPGAEDVSARTGRLRGPLRDARFQSQQAQRVAPIERQLLDLLRSHHIADRRVSGLDAFVRALHLNHFGRGPWPQVYIYNQRNAHGKDVMLSGQSLKPRKRDRHCVRSRRQGRNAVRPCGAGLGLVADARVLIGDFHRRVRYHRLSGIDDCALDARRAALGPCHTGQRAHQKNRPQPQTL